MYQLAKLSREWLNMKIKFTTDMTIKIIRTHSDHRAGDGVDIVTEYEVRLGSLQIQMKFYLEKMKLR